MSLSPEHTRRLTAFPAMLRQLVAAELAAGNAIAEFSGGFPAPPAGDCLKLARPVTTRPHATGAGLRFRARNSSLWSGEFTDADGFYFVIEPPNPPPPEPDMDAIRKSLEPQPDALGELAHRRPGSRVARFIASRRDADADKAIITTETATGRTHLLHFRDMRTPHEIQFALERELMTLFTAALEDGELRLRARAKVIGARYEFDLRFVAALARGNYYSLRVEASWADAAATHHDYFHKTFDGWIELWTRDLMPATPPAAGEGSRERYREIAEAALTAETQLDSVAAIQSAIVAGLKRGGSYATSHKEGGTNINWKRDRFVRTDFGDDPDSREYVDEAEFLLMLQQFCDSDVTRHADREPLVELNRWKLILRRMTTR